MQPSNLNKDFNDQTSNSKLKLRHYKCQKKNYGPYKRLGV